MSRRIALVMAGGGGTRLWPASTGTRPKQVLPGLPEVGATLLGATVQRLEGLVDPQDVHVVTTRDQIAQVHRAVPSLGEEQVIAEPFGRNTAPCIALFTVHLRARLGAEAGEATIIALPADHFVGDAAGFRRALEAACVHAQSEDTIATLGIEPSRPDTGYGYMERDADPRPTVSGDHGVPAYRALRFVEKPDLDTAKQYLETGRYLWNAGIFVMPVARLESDLARHCGATWAALDPVRKALAAHTDFEDATRRAYQTVEAAPIDIALAEKLDDIVVVPADVGWNDLGTWQSIGDTLPSDGAGNVVHTGDGAKSAILDTTDSVVWNEDGTVGVLGVSGLAVVVSEGRVLVCPLERAQEVRRLVESLD